MKDEITYKLSDFLDSNRLFTHESHIVCILVELRKLLDHYNADAPLLRFYADWPVHTRKDRISSAFRKVAETLYLNAKTDIEDKYPQSSETYSPIGAFAHGDTLARELQTFLLVHQLPSDLTRDAKTWASFAKLLIKVLEDQPIIRPCDGVKSMSFERAAENAVILRLDFLIRSRGITTIGT
jgi:hypothetical protein